MFTLLLRTRYRPKPPDSSRSTACGGSLWHIFPQYRFATLGFVTVFSLITLVLPPKAVGTSEKPPKVDCRFLTGPCKAHLSDTAVILDISPKPVRAMQDLTFTVTLTGVKTAAEPHIDLGMPGMHMGRNRVMLKPIGESVFRGTGVIVRCPSGSRIWRARVTVPEIGSVDFIFDVIY